MKDELITEASNIKGEHMGNSDISNNVNISGSTFGSNNNIGNIVTDSNLTNIQSNFIGELDKFEESIKNLLDVGSRGPIEKEISNLKLQVEQSANCPLDKDVVFKTLKSIYQKIKTANASDSIKLFAMIPSWLSYLGIRPEDIGSTFL